MTSPRRTAVASPFAALARQDFATTDSGASTPKDASQMPRHPHSLPNPELAERTGSGERARRTPDPHTSRSMVGGEQEARLRDAVNILERDIHNRRSMQATGSGSLPLPTDLPEHQHSGPLEAEAAHQARAQTSRPSRSHQRKSLEAFLALDIRRSRPNSNPTSGHQTPSVVQESGSTTASNSLQCLSATTQDMVDLMTIRASNLRHRESMRRALPHVREDDPQQMGAGSAAEAENQSTDRQAFGLGAGWSIITPEGPPAQAVQRALAFYSEETENKQSLVPFFKTVPTIVGKVSVALGADMLTLGLSNGDKLLVRGGASAIAIGVGVVVFAMWLLLLDMRRINRRRVPLTALSTVLGMGITTAGLVVGEADMGAKSLGIRSISAVVIGIGLTLLNNALPLSFAYSELVHGDTFRNYRNEIAFLLQGIGLGLATGLTLSRGAPRDNIKPVQFPFGVAHAFAVLGIAMNTMGTCFTATNLQRTQGRFVALRTRLRQHADQVRQPIECPPSA